LKNNIFSDINHNFPRKYETVIIINPDLDDSQYNQFIEKIKGIIVKENAEIVSISDWGLRKLSYEIKKISKGRYVVIHFLAKSNVVAELERNLRNIEDCLRYQTVLFTNDLESSKEEAVNV
jgi:small subunit ribosomal protein S6